MKARVLVAATVVLAVSSFAVAEEPTEKKLEPVVVTASRFEEPTEKVPASVTVITSEDIQPPRPRPFPTS